LKQITSYNSTLVKSLISACNYKTVDLKEELDPQFI
jgi:hypothetical protein